MGEIEKVGGEVRVLRDEFSEWLKRYQPIPGEVRVPATVWFGVMQKCCNYVEALMATCLQRLLPIAGEAGEAQVQRIGDGKPLDRLTLGQCVQLLEALDPFISPALRKRLPNLFTDSRLLGKSGIAMLHKLSRMRNDFAHRRWQHDGDNLAAEFLANSAELCNSRLVTAVTALDDGQAEQGTTADQTGE